MIDRLFAAYLFTIYLRNLRYISGAFVPDRNRQLLLFVEDQKREALRIESNNFPTLVRLICFSAFLPNNLNALERGRDCLRTAPGHCSDRRAQQLGFQ